MLPFVDVQPADWFYQYVAYMYCRGLVSGYDTNPPCDAGTPCFKPNNPATRGQVSKIVTLAFGLPINTSGGPHFTDVLPGSTFYAYIETMYNAGIVNGYPDHTFRPDNWLSRGQAVKIVVNTAVYMDPAHWSLLNPSTKTFEDVEVGSAFFTYVETASAHAIVQGYPCGQPGVGPCVQPQNKPYFLPYSNTTRAQVSKIVYLAINFP